MSKFVLVPGAWLGAWVWKKVTPLLEEKGHEVYPVTLTGEGERVHLAGPEVGMETAIQDVQHVIQYNELDEFVLVGHSFAGKVVAAVADRIPHQVKLLLYLDAFRPDPVETPQGGFDPQKEFGPAKPGAWGVPLTEKVLDSIGKDVQGADRARMLSLGTPWPLRHGMDPVTLSKKLNSVKCAYIFCSGSGDPVDEIVAGKWGKLEGPHKVIDSGHWPMVTKPKELAEDLLALASP